LGRTNVGLPVADGARTPTQHLTRNGHDDNNAPRAPPGAAGATPAVGVAENQTGVTTVTATDVDALDTPTFSLSGGSDAGLFAIDPSTGVLSFNTAPDFEAATDADANGVYEVEVTVDDGHGGTDTQSISITVTDANEAPVANDDPGAFSADVLSLSPVSYWRLGETSGTSVTDIGSAGNATGTYNGPSLGESDPVNGDPDTAAGFNRTELDYIEIAHDDAYRLDEGTVQLWFNADDLAQDQTLFSKDSSGLDTGGHLTIRVLTGGSVETRLQSTSGDNFVYSGAGSVTAGNWHHVAFSFGSGGMQLYLDGNRVDTNPYTGGLGTTSGGAGNYEPIAIGASTRTSGDGTVTPLNDYFDGRIDEVAIFGTALSGADINRLSGGALQHYTLAEDTSLSVAAAEGVLANDFDEEGDPLTAILVSGPTKAASFTLNADGSFNYTPIADFSGTDSFTYRADDGTAGSNVATVTINVANVNDVPVIDSDGGGATAALSVAENQTGVTTVTATDVDALDTPTFSLSGGSDAALFAIDPNTGVLSFNTAPDFEAATDADANGVYEVEVTVDDGHGGTDT
ncbi:MAG: tandem-95 repeat protein, partial [Actinomycetia bacterium]|nr:tandem-95 repeat protein [Actinomycetes bacterium]